MSIQPSRDIQAAMDSVEFYKTQKLLQPGTYQITEHDGEINFATVDRYSNVKWYSQWEYDLTVEHAIHEQQQSDRLDAIMRFDPEDQEDLMDSWDNAMIAEEGRRRADEIPFDDHDLEGERWNEMVANQSADAGHALDDSQAVCADVAADKTLADLLRVALAKEPEFVVDVPATIESVQQFVSDGYRDYTLDQTEFAQKASGVGIDCDTSGLKTVFKDGVVVHEESMETIRERTQESLKATDVVRDESGDCYLLRGYRV